MSGIALALFTLGLVADLVELPSDVFVVASRRFQMPINRDKLQGEVKQIRLFVSADRGKSWKHEGDYEPTAEQVKFEAPEDGLYWFDMQVVFKDDKREPADLKKLSGIMKVFVNTSGKPIKVRKTYLELQQENEQLRKKVEELEKKLAERESGRKPE